MTAILFDGFDHRDAIDRWTNINSGNYATDIVRTGSTSFIPGGGNSDLALYLDLSSTDDDDGITVGFGFYAVGGADQQLLSFVDRVTNVCHVSLRFQGTSRGWQLRRGGDGFPFALSAVLADTEPNIAIIGTWHYIEVKVKIADSGGTIELRQDGVTRLSYAGDTQNGGVANVDRIAWSSRINGLNYRIDDIYILNEQGSLNNDFLGDTRCYPLYPNGNGNYSQLVGSDGNSTDNYLLVDESPAPSSADYVGSATPGDKDTYTFEDMPVSVGTVRGVETRVFAAKTDTGTKQVRALIRRSATDANGVDHALADSAYVTFQDMWEQDPHAGPGAWTITNVNGSEFGAEVRS